MVNPSIQNAPEPGHYHSKYLIAWHPRQDWTQIILTKAQHQAVMENNYVHMEVFFWLDEHVGPNTSFNRTGKGAIADNWVYTMDEAFHHIFFFKNPNDAIRFKLTWA